MKPILLKFLSLCVALVFVVSFAGCKKIENTKNADSSGQETVKQSDAADLPEVPAIDSDASSSGEPVSDSASSVQSTSDAEVKSDAGDELKTQSSAEKEAEDVKPQQQKPAEEVKPKYSDAEIYEKGGKKYSKTEDGDEVEISGDNMQKMMEDYQKVQGTGNEKEREILDRMQVILDNADQMK